MILQSNIPIKLFISFAITLLLEIFILYSCLKNKIHYDSPHFKTVAIACDRISNMVAKVLKSEYWFIPCITAAYYRIEFQGLFQ